MCFVPIYTGIYRYIPVHNLYCTAFAQGTLLCGYCLSLISVQAMLNSHLAMSAVQHHVGHVYIYMPVTVAPLLVWPVEVR